MRSRTLFQTCALAAIILTMSIFAHGAYRVTKTADTNDGVCDADCSLREAVQAATDSPVSNVVDFSPALAGGTIVLTLGEIAVNNVRVIGYGAKYLTIDAAGQSRIFYVSGNESVIAGLTLTGGNGSGVLPVGGAPGGGAIRAANTVLLQALNISDSDGSFGGGVFFDSSGTVVNCTFSGNTAPDGGSQIWLEAGALNINNSTFTAPGTIATGHGIMNMRNSTAPVSIRVNGSGGAFTFVNSIIGQVFINKLQSVGVSHGFNIVLDPTQIGAGVVFAGSDKLNVDPLLMPLADNGGAVPTMAIGPGSPAIDAGNNTLATTGGSGYDARRFARVADGNGDANAVADIGAYEYLSTQLANTIVAGMVSDGSGRPVSRATVTITDLEGNTKTAQTSPFGVYGFSNVAVGLTFFSVEAKGHRGGPAQVIANPAGTTFNITVQ